MGKERQRGYRRARSVWRRDLAGAVEVPEVVMRLLAIARSELVGKALLLLTY